MTNKVITQLNQVTDLPLPLFPFFKLCQSLKTKGPPELWRPFLKDKTAILYFEEVSTRTRLSFELAAKKLGLTVLTLEGGQSSHVKGESLKDTLENMAWLSPDVLVVRTAAPTLPKTQASIPTINAGTGATAHPTQALADLLTLFEAHHNALPPLAIGYCGDVSRSRVFQSHMRLKKLWPDLSVSLCAPTPIKNIPNYDGPFTYFSSRQAMAKKANVIYSIRPQKERSLNPDFKGDALTEPTQFYKIEPQDLTDSTWLMSPGPINYETDMNPSLLTHPRSLIPRQVENGLYVRMALLALALGVPQ